MSLRLPFFGQSSGHTSLSPGAELPGCGQSRSHAAGIAALQLCELHLFGLLFAY